MKSREWNPPSHYYGAARIEDRELVVGSSRCDDRSAQRADPTRTAGRGTRVLPQCLCVSAVILLFAFTTAFAQNYSIDWHTIDGGGGTSTGGVYSVTGTIGQPDASITTMTGGQYSLTGGFWALYAVQTPGAPLLTITLTTTNTAVVSWPYPSTGWDLQENGDLTTTNWITPSETVNNDGTNNFIIVNPPAASKFYRLFSP